MQMYSGSKSMFIFACNTNQKGCRLLLNGSHVLYIHQIKHQSAFQFACRRLQKDKGRLENVSFCFFWLLTGPSPYLLLFACFYVNINEIYNLGLRKFIVAE
jgi:hypothetical protein